MTWKEQGKPSSAGFAEELELEVHPFTIFHIFQWCMVVPYHTIPHTTKQRLFCWPYIFTATAPTERPISHGSQKISDLIFFFLCDDQRGNVMLESNQCKCLLAKEKLLLECGSSDTTPPLCHQQSTCAR
jgi:hypothetical protein